MPFIQFRIKHKFMILILLFEKLRSKTFVSISEVSYVSRHFGNTNKLGHVNPIRYRKWIVSILKGKKNNNIKTMAFVIYRSIPYDAQHSKKALIGVV